MSWLTNQNIEREPGDIWALLIDKVKVQQKLIKDKCTHQLIVYVDLGVTQLNFSTFNYCDALASYISVVFFILEEHYVTLSLQ